MTMSDEFEAIISHPADPDAEGDDSDEDGDVLLAEHAQTVADRAERLGADRQRGPALRCLGWLHDFGKVTPAFQQYVRGDYTGDRKLRYHGRLGAFATFHALERLGASETQQLAGVIAVARHHGRLPNAAEYTIQDIVREEKKSGTRQYATQQVEQIASSRLSRDVADQLLSSASDEATSWDTFQSAFQSDLFDELEAVAGKNKGFSVKPAPEKLSDTLYDVTLRNWTALTLADKTAASGLYWSDLRREPLDVQPLDDYVERLLGDGSDGARELEELIQRATAATVDPTDERSLNALREATRRRVRRNVTRLLDADIGKLTLPTGLGKTITGTTAALTLRDAIAEESELDQPPTVLYALPYTAIIEQTRDLFESPDKLGADPTGHEFTVHHYLSDTVTFPDEMEARDGTKELDAGTPPAALLGESWRSGFVLTTFVQLFESLAGPTNAQGLKLPSLRDAVVILDEPQTVPKRWWTAVPRLAQTLVEEFGATIISMTATQPALFEDGFDTISLLEESADDENAKQQATEASTFRRRVFESVSRVRYHVDPSVSIFAGNELDDTLEGEPWVTHQVGGRRLVERALGNHSRVQDDSEHSTDESGSTGKSVLAVTNTIKSSRTLTDAVTDAAKDADCEVVIIGDAYESVLSTRDQPEAPAESDLPAASDLAAKTLERLGVDPAQEGGGYEDRRVSDHTVMVGTFNSRYRPVDRRALVEVADALTTVDIPFVFVSTQAIEAGVDISFASAFRDIAPLDSIVQTAGRCNRSFEWGVDGGDITVWCLGPTDEGEEDDTDGDGDRKHPAEYVYDEPEHLSVIADILVDTAADSPGDGDGIPAMRFTTRAVPRYFEELGRDRFADASITNAIDTFDGDRLARSSFIDEDYRTIDLLVGVTAADRARIDFLRDLFQTAPRQAYDRLSELSDLRISVPERDAEESLTRHSTVDGSSRSDPDGISVLVHRGTESEADYKLSGGGFRVETDDDVSSRFSF